MMKDYTDIGATTPEALEISRKSRQLISELIGDRSLEDRITQRCVIATGDPSVAEILRFRSDPFQAGLPALFERAHALGLTTSLDTNYDPSEQWLGLDHLLAHTDIFFPNETETCSLAGTPDVPLAAQRLARKVKTLVVKLGGQGALAIKDGVRAQTAALAVKVVDTVGAGDSFDAGFMYGALHGWPLDRTLRLAAVCGGLSTRAAGGTTAQATLEEARAYGAG